MKDETSLFGVPPERVDRLLRHALAPPEGNGETAAAPALDRFGEKPGGRIDRYQLLRVLGEGGMGIVYLAQQDEPVKRQVALKIIKPGMDSKRVLNRFEAEKQALALMDHPHIARVIDAGLTLSARPYFVMDYVKGLPITEFCDQHKLTIEERLRLFLQICHAVHHAHQKGIIHRDIKPSNILVTDQDDRTIPKIIDFGIAKALTGSLTEGTLSTEQGQLFGTPEYMSPEQADLSTEDIDTRSDIYSLGVLLYVLLAGVLPFDSDTLREGGVEHIRRIIRETDPKTPSTRLKNLGQEAKKVAESRRTELVVLTKCLHKELEWIPLKAIRKERTERYRSASELADDIDSYLKGVPLIAGPESGLYRLRKSIRRHRHVIAAAAVVIASLVLGLVVSVAMYCRSERSRQDEAAARAEARAVSDFLRNRVLASLDPFKVGGREITIRSVWDAAAESLEGEFQGTPLAEAEIHDTIGNGYWSLGLTKKAELHLTRAWQIQQALRGPEHPATLKSAHQLGWVYYAQSRYSEAEKLLFQTREARRRLTGEEDPNTLYSTIGLACVYTMQGRLQKGEELLEQTIEIGRRVLSEEHLYVLGAMNAMASNYEFQGRYDEAERLAEQGLEIARRELGENDWVTLLLKHTMGEVCLYFGNYDKAEEFFQEALKGRREAWDPEHPDTLQTLMNLGLLYIAQGRYEKAESSFVQIQDSTRRVLGKSHVITVHLMRGLGTVYLSQGRYDEAKLLLDEAFEIGNRIVGEEHWATQVVMNMQAGLYTAQGHYAEAEDLNLRTLEIQRRVLGHEHPHTLATINSLAVLRTKQKQYEDAERLFHEAFEARKKKLGEDNLHTLETKNDLATLYKEKGDYAQAEPLLLEALKGRRLKLGDTHPRTLESWNNLIDLYEGWNKPEKAEKRRAKLPQTDAVRE